MSDFFYVAAMLLRFIIEIYYVFLFARAVLSWLPEINNGFTAFIYAVTEPVLAPVRTLLDRLGVTTALPIDLSFLVVVLVLWLILNIL